MLIFRRIVIALLYVSSQFVPVLLIGKLTVTPQYKIGKLESKVTLSCLSNYAKMWRKWPPGSTKDQVVTVDQQVTYDFVHCSTSGSYEGQGSFNLIIPNLNYTDAGKYQCMDEKGDAQYAELIVMGSDLECSSSCSNPILISCSATYYGNDGILKLNFHLDDDINTKSLPSNSTQKKPNPLSTIEAHAETESSIYGQTCTCSATLPETTQTNLSCSTIICNKADGNIAMLASIGSSVGGILIIAFIVVAVFMFHRYWKKNKETEDTTKTDEGTEKPVKEPVNNQHAKENEYAVTPKPTQETQPLLSVSPISIPDKDPDDNQNSAETIPDKDPDDNQNSAETIPDKDPDDNQNSAEKENIVIKEETKLGTTDIKEPQPTPQTNRETGAPPGDSG